MAYNPHSTTSEDRFPSGIVFFGASSTKPMLDSSSAFIIDEDNNSLALADGYYLGSQSYRQLLNLASDGTATFASGVIVQGNLTVNGDVVTVNTEQILVEDNVITLSSGAYEDPSQNAGIEIYRGSGSHDVMSLIWNETSDKWTFTDTSGTYDLVGAYLSQELRYKILDGDYNDFANIPNDGLSNSSITITAGTGLKTGGEISLGSTGVLDIDLNDLPTGAIANGDSIAFIDANDSNLTKKESIADIATLFAGDGLTATNSVINVVGGTGITASSGSLDIDSTIITSQTLMPSGDVNGDNDQILIYDSGTGLKRITGNDFISGLDLLTTFNITDGTNTSALDRDEALTFSPGTGSGVGITPVVSTVSNAPVVTLNVNNDLILGRNDANFDPGDYLLFYDADSALLKRLSHNQLVSDISDAISGVAGGTIMSFWTAYDDRTTGDDSNIAIVDNLTSLQFLDASGIDVTVDGINKRVTVGLEPTSVSTGTYGSVSGVGSFTVDQNGRITSASEEVIDIISSQVSDFTTASETAIFTDANFISGTAFDFDVDSGASVSGAVRYDNSTIGINGSNQLYVPNGGIDTTQLAADAVDGTKIADESIDSEHYVDGSIDTEHLSDGAVTEAKVSRTVDTYTGTSSITHDVALANSTGSITLTLPSPSSGKIVRVKNINSGTVTINSSAGNIDGASSKILYYLNESMTFVGNGSNWFIV